jgi:hypothetical protein
MAEDIRNVSSVGKDESKDDNFESADAVASKAKPEIDKLGMEVGVDTNLAFTTPFNPVGLGVKPNDNERLNEVMKQDWDEHTGPTVRQLVTMRRMDGQARALYRLLTLPIRAALNAATFVPADGGDAEAEFIDQVFNTPPAAGGMTTTFQRFMAQLLQGLFDGFAAFEKVYWIPEEGPLKGKITLKKLAHRPADTITFIADDSGGFAGLRQRAVNGGKYTDVYIEPDYAFYYAAQEEERKFYGVSFFQSAFYHYDKKVKLYYTAHLAAQRHAVGTRIGTVPPQASRAAKEEFSRSLGNLALAQYMMLPEGFKVELLNDSGAYDFLALINHHNSQMSKSILAAFFDENQGAGASEGSLVNFSRPGDDMFILMLKSVMDDIANAINHYIIPTLIDYNFPGGNYPKFTWGKLTEEQKAAVSNTFDKLATAGQSANVTPEFMRALEETVAAEMGLEIDYDEIEQREKDQADQQAQMQQMGSGPGVPPADPNAPPQTDEAGNPVPPAQGGAPGAPAPASGNDAQIEDFENQVAKLTADEQIDNLLRLAGEMLDAYAE